MIGRFPDLVRQDGRRSSIPNIEKDGSFSPEPPQHDGLKSVLVADDDPIVRHLLQKHLRDWGYRVMVAVDGQNAWELLQRPDEAPDLIILDWLMPGIDGIELCRRIRQREQNPYQYILLVSGKDDKQNVVEGLDAGADDYLTKPFDIGELRARLRAGKRILTLQHNLIHAQEELRYQATHDALTGLWSRGAVLSLLSTELERGIRTGASTGILMIDLDHFKNVNDTYGHLTGDAVLQQVASRIGRTVRSYDFVGRYGGEEFIAILSDCSPGDLNATAERIRVAVSETPIVMQPAAINVTVSIGSAVTSNGSPDLNCYPQPTRRFTKLSDPGETG